MYPAWSLFDYLRVKLWCDCGYPGGLKHTLTESHTSYNQQFTDWVTHCVWKAYEDDDSQYLDILRPHIKLRPLFF